MAVISVLRNNGKEITRARNSTLSNIKINDVDFNFANKKLASGKNLVNIPIINSTTNTDSIQCYLTKRIIVSCQEYPTLIANDSGVETSVWRLSFTYLDGTVKYIVDDGFKKIGNYVDYCTASEENPIILITYRSTYIRQGQYKGIQIEYGSTITEYEEYNGTQSRRVCKNAVNEPIIDMQISGNSVQDGTPTPETSIEVQSCGEKTKNLADINTGLDKQLIKNNDGTYKLEYNTEHISGFIKVNLEAGKTYTISAEIIESTANYVSNGKTYCMSLFSNTSGETTEYYNALPAPSSSNRVYSTFTPKYNHTTISLYINKSNVGVGSYVLFKNFQIEENSTMTDYEPYGYKVPVNVGGKNLFNPLVKGISINFTNGSESKNSNYASTNYISVDFNTNPNYYLSGLISGLHSCIYAYNSEKVFLGRTSGGARTSLSLNSAIFSSGTPQGEGNIAYLRVSQYYVSGTSTNVLDDIDNAKIQLEVGTTATNYEPYIEPTSTPIYLNEPLRKIADYADYIDYKNKKVVRNIKELILNGSESWVVASATYGYRAYISDSQQTINPIVNGVGLSNRFKITTTLAKSGEFVTRTQGGIQFAQDFALTRSEWESWLNSNNIIVYYPTATPIEETIELPTIETFDGITIFDIETTIEPSEVKVNYWKQI